MKRMVRDFVLLFASSFVYSSLNKMVSVSISQTLIVSLGFAGLFSLLNEIVRCLSEQDLKLKKSLSKMEIEKMRQTRLVVRDSIVTFLVCYGSMTSSLKLGAGLSFFKVLPFIIVALAPTVVITAISKEIRMPSARNVQQEITGYEFKKLA